MDSALAQVAWESSLVEPGHDRALEAYARRRLGIPHHTIRLADEYRAGILDNFRGEYLAGRTPNPCVRCNQQMKFGLLLERAEQAGLAFEVFATGHYARIEAEGESRLLRRAADAAKDQTYFLARLPRALLPRLRFPLGGLTKEQVRRIAREAGFGEVAAKAESQDFIEAKDYSVLFREEDARPGPIVDRQGRVVGEHRGLQQYTVGQRKGLGLGGRDEPLYVVRLDGRTNTVYVGPREDLFSARMTVSDLNWLGPGEPPAQPRRVGAKIRQQHAAAAATLTPGGKTGAVVEFDEPQMSVTPGQTAVFYEGDTVLGGALIESAG